VDLTACMDAVADRLEGLGDLRVWAYPPGSVSPPAAVVSYPEEIDFDKTYGRGADRMRLPLVLVVGKASDRAAREALGAYCDGSGPSSVKARLESGTFTDFDSLRVINIEFDVVSIGGVDYLAALFDLDIFGSGT
jgi:hypothetical protein